MRPKMQAPYLWMLLGLALTFLDGGAADAQSTLRSLQVDGRTRTYYLHVPPSYTGATPVPLVLVLHGWGGNGRGIEQGSGFSAKADQAGFIVVYPNALNFPSAWNCPWTSSNGDPALDLAFFTSLLDELEGAFAIDSGRIFVTGISNGGCMAHLLGAVFPDRIAAIAPVAAAVGSYRYGDLLQAPKPARPVSVAIFHGLHDRLVPYEGGPWGTLFIPMVSVPHSTAFWVWANGCDPEPRTILSADENIIEDTFVKGAEGTEVRLYTILDGRHEWRRGPGFDTTAVMWDFFLNVPPRR